MLRFSRAQAVAVSLAAAGAWIALVPPEGFSTQQALVTGIALSAIGLWATAALPEVLTALLFFVLCMILKVAPAKVVFSGFMSSAFWLIFAGLVYGAAIKSTGLGDRVAHAVGSRMGGSFAKALAGVVVMGMGLAFLMPSSMGRIVLMVPLLTALASHLGYSAHGRGWNGLVMGGMIATFLPSFSILPANIPNMVLAGAVEALLGAPPSYAGYLAAHFPVLGFVKGLFLYLVLWLTFRGEEPSKSEEPPPGAMTAPERRLAFVLALAIGFWMTDSLHHVSPAWIGLTGAIVCLLPATGILPPKSLSTISLEPAVYVAGVIGMGTLIDHSGVGKLVSGMIIDLLPLSPEAAFVNFMSLAALAMLTGLATTQPGVPAVLTPFAPTLAQATGLPVGTVLITQVAGFSTLLLPYQAPPVMTGIQISHANAHAFTRLILIMAAITVTVLWPLDFLWLELTGHF
jgi:di/tricarboxylate transporter